VDTFHKKWSGIGIGGARSADFANTLDWRLRKEPVELLRTYEDLLRWGRSSEILTPAEAGELKAWGEAHPAAARRTLSHAVQVREAIAEVFLAVIREVPVPQESLARLDAACRAAGAARALRPEGTGAAWGWKEDRPSPERVTWAASLDAARILTSPDRRRLRQCGDFECGWLFLDTSKNRSRRWCSMKGCGNRNKARSYYRRAAGKAPTGG